MIREIAAAIGGVLSGLTAILVVLFYPGVTSSPDVSSTGIYRLQPIAGPISASENLRFSSGASGVYSGIITGFLLLFMALGAGILVAYLGVGRLKGEDLQ